MEFYKGIIPWSFSYNSFVKLSFYNTIHLTQSVSMDSIYSVINYTEFNLYRVQTIAVNKSQIQVRYPVVNINIGIKHDFLCFNFCWSHEGVVVT